jgi:hypothetical protein
VVSEVLIAVPVLGRPGNAAALVERARITDVPYLLLFLCSPGDDDEIRACVATGAEVVVVPWGNGPGDYARKINHACALELAPWILMGADDLCFCPGWASLAIAQGERTGVGVIGTNDMGNPRVMSGDHATHPLVRAAYVRESGTIDEPGKMLHEGYRHNFCDTELVATARARGEWSFCFESKVPHLHPHWGHGQLDETYRIGLSGFHEDRDLFAQREDLWS